MQSPTIEELIQDAGSTNDSYYQDLLEEYGVEDVDNSDDDDDDNDDAIISVIDVHDNSSPLLHFPC
jgi:hypothetical protein